MEKRINVMRDIESRRRIAERPAPASVKQETPQTDAQKTERTETYPDSDQPGTPKSRRRKTEGNA